MGSLIEEEYETYTHERKWKQVYDVIQNEAYVLHNSSSQLAKLPENRSRNRYRDVSPYDDYRVVLNDSVNNYINASRIEVPLSKRSYILTQGPLPNTSGHFWLMIWQQNTKGIMMLNKIIEDGRLKCHPYFPMGAEFGAEDSLTYADVSIRVDYLKCEDYGYFVIRTFKLVHLETQEEKSVLQFHYMDWPDFGIPKNSESFLNFLYAVRQSGVIPSAEGSSDTPSSRVCGPPVIHCSAGIGRSGTFILVDSALVLVERTKSLASLDLKSMLIDMRKYRCGLIQRPEQLQFSYMAILDGAQAILNSPVPSPDKLVAGDEEISDVDSDDTDILLQHNGDVEEELKDADVEESLFVDTSPPPDAEPDTEPSAEPGPEPSAQPGPEPDVVEEQHTVPKAQETAPSIEVNKDIPDPPKRTSSLNKAASLDEHPPPVPPRPPSNFDRQKSAPPVPEEGSSSSQSLRDNSEEDGYYENISSNPMKRKREEAVKKTREKIEMMRAKQRAAEEAKNRRDVFPSRRVMIGAGLTIAFAIGVMYCVRSYGL